jgi:xanthine/CO dehydrogenase XdhC/CoxF family maturation factor
MKWEPNKVEAQFISEVREMGKGEKRTYHRGAHCGGQLRLVVRRLIDTSVVTAVTKKHGKGDYEYMVVKL